MIMTNNNIIGELHMKDCPCCYGHGVTFNDRPSSGCAAVHNESLCLACNGDGTVSTTRYNEVRDHLIAEGFDVKPSTMYRVWMYRVWNE